MLIDNSVISSGLGFLDFVFERSLLRSYFLEVLSLLSSYEKNVDFVLRLRWDNICYCELSFYYRVDEGFIYCSCKGLYLKSDEVRNYRFSCSKGVSSWNSLLDGKVLLFIEKCYKAYSKSLKVSSG
jgi:hypothetical protein